MEEISAFAIYSSRKSKGKKGKKSVKSPKLQKSAEKNMKSKKNGTVTPNKIAKQAMIQQILEQQFKKKVEKTNKKYKINGSTQDFGKNQTKKTKFSTSTPRQQNINQKNNDLRKMLSDEETDKGSNIPVALQSKDEQNSMSSETFLSSEEEDEVVERSPKTLKGGKSSYVVCSNGNENRSRDKDHVKIEISNITHNKLGISPTPKNNSVEDGEKIFKWLMNGIDIKTFFTTYWEKAPCLMHRKNNANYYSELISFAMIDKMFLENHVEFTKNIDITKYENGARTTLNPEGRALPGIVWEKYADGCSIRLLNPQTFLSSIFGINTTLQEYFHCMVGANVYLTPPNSQGFAPHYDDIEAFVIQIEGKKQWKLYNPRSKNEELPRFSSPNFQQNEIGEPILEETLEPGSILYFPRGTIHQANTVPGCHSLHITLSVYQRQSYADLCEKLFPLILERAIQDDIEIRRGLPLHIWNNMGIVHSDAESNEREEVFKHVRGCIKRAISEISIDDAVDQLAKKFQHEALPPQIKTTEKSRTVFGCKNYLNENGEVMSNYELTLESKIRLLRAHILRLVQEEDTFRIYFYIDNSKEYKEYEPNFIEIESEQAAGIEVLVKCYPDYIYVKDLPLEDEETKLAVSQALWDRGLIMLNNVVEEGI